jgi:hypothetical protein
MPRYRHLGMGAAVGLGSHGAWLKNEPLSLQFAHAVNHRSISMKVLSAAGTLRRLG